MTQNSKPNNHAQRTITVRFFINPIVALTSQVSNLYKPYAVSTVDLASFAFLANFWYIYIIIRDLTEECDVAVFAIMTRLA